MTKARVVIVGAGPVGMVCALALNRRGIPVTVFEQEPAPPRDQRANSIHPPTLEMLDELGIAAKIIPLGLISTTYQFHDRPTRSLVAEFDLGRLADEIRFPFVLQYEQYKLTASIAEEFANAGDFDVRFSHGVADLVQNSEGVEIEITTPLGTERMQAAYVIGCDGGRSTVRKLANIEFEGFTYPERFIKIATTFDFETVVPNISYRNYFSDPDEWASLFKVGGEDACGAVCSRYRPTRATTSRWRPSESRHACTSSFQSPGATMSSPSASMACTSGSRRPFARAA